MKAAILTYRNEAKLAPYLEALRQAGIQPTPVSPAKPIASLQGMGLLLTGGSDIDPSLYGQPLDPRADPPDRERDDLEQRLLREALSRDFPVLAICRGMQLFNITHAGGSLLQHMDGHKLANNGTHAVEIRAGSRLAEILGGGGQSVNSRHHQAVANVGAQLVVSATSADGVIEAVERPDLRFAIAVQWHPEDLLAAFPQQLRLFEAFGESLRP
ncbi:MAG TPA: gamma-glutamyl-gamma-aminobutyrate hydrolase family protein [Bryobacteraceae bacterium]|nr:gamma-glutamyl-gamma-aminobutyrate hydrolase family protein [Bryobacteraceae bacterium]